MKDHPIYTSNPNKLQIAQEIKNQLGHKALYMLGAKDFVGGPNYLTFKIRGSKAVNYITIYLNALDLYEIKFLKVRALVVKVVKEYTEVYCDDLLKLIRLETGLETNL